MNIWFEIERKPITSSAVEDNQYYDGEKWSSSEYAAKLYDNYEVAERIANAAKSDNNEQYRYFILTCYDDANLITYFKEVK